MCLEGGKGVAKDRPRALEYYRMAAAQGKREAVAAIERLSAKR
jgi:TPR repeat protein